MQRKSMADLQRGSAGDVKHSEKRPLIVMLENVRSMHNVGSIFRTCDAFGIEALFLCGYTPRPPHRDIHKTALGATETVSWKGFDRASDAVDQLGAMAYPLWAAEQVHGSVALQDFSNKRREPLALVFGNEVDGVSPETLARCNGAIEIPQFGMKHSLNISVAVGVVLWELIRELPDPFADAVGRSNRNGEGLWKE